MFFTCSHLRNMVTKNNNWYLVDTCKTFDADWETAVAEISAEELNKFYGAEADEMTEELVWDYLETVWCVDWDVVKNYKTEKSAFIGHNKICKNLIK